MTSKTWYQRLFKTSGHLPIRKQAGQSTRPMEVELLEDRQMPTNTTLIAGPALIFITGNVTNSTVSSDPSRFQDGAVAPLIRLGPVANHIYLAKNLRSAVADAEQFTGNTTIFLDSGTDADSTYQVTEGELLIQYNPSATGLTIENRTGGANTSIIDANGDSRIFEVDRGGLHNAAVTKMDRLVLQNGSVQGTQGAAEGGAILNEGLLVLTNDQFRNNSATGVGGGVNGTDAVGGAIFNDSTAAGNTLNIANSTFDSNSAAGESFVGAEKGFFVGGAGEGGAIGIGAGAVNITASTFSNNTAHGGDVSGGEGNTGGAAFGGAIQAAQTSVKVNITNSTFAANSASGGSASSGKFAYGGNAYGGAIAVSNQNAFSLVNDTIALNNVFSGEGDESNTDVAYGGGVSNFGATADVKVVNTIIADNQAIPGENSNGTTRPDISGSFTSLGHNLIGDNTGGTGFTAKGDLVNVESGLDPNGLANNGGPTQTIALLPTSKAINAGDNRVTTNPATIPGLVGVAALHTDQRSTGFARLSAGTTDIGAYEFQFPNLNRSFSFRSSTAGPTTLMVPNAQTQGLLAGACTTGLPEGYFYAVVPIFQTFGPGTFLEVNPDGSFSFTVPAKYRGTISFQFKLVIVGGEQEGDITDTNLTFTATIQVTAQSGRGSAGTYLPVVFLPGTGDTRPG
jgi:hypothetical protein